MSKTNVHKTVSDMQKSAKVLLNDIKSTRHKTRDSISVYKGLESDIKQRDALARQEAKRAEIEAKAVQKEPKVKVEPEPVKEVAVKPEPKPKQEEKPPVKKAEPSKEAKAPVVEAKKPDKAPQKPVEEKKPVAKPKAKPKAKPVEKAAEPKKAAKKPEPVKKPEEAKKPEAAKKPEPVNEEKPKLSRMEELRLRNIKASHENRANEERLKRERAAQPKVEKKPQNKLRRPQGDNRRPQGQRPQGDNRRPQGQRPQGDNRNYQSRNNNNRQQGQRPQGDNRNYQSRNNNGRPQGQRPQGDNRNYQSRNNNTRPQSGDRNYQSRNNNTRPQNSGGRSNSAASSSTPKVANRPKNTSFGKRPTRQTGSNYNDNHSRKNKKQIAREQAPGFEYGDVYVPRGSRKRGKKPRQQRKPIERIVIEHAIITTEDVLVKDLAEKIGKPVADIVKQLMFIGTMATANQYIDFDTAQLVASELGVEVEQQLAMTNEEKMLDTHDIKNDKDAITRPPVVTIMGHVDHGKTSLLDAIKKTHVTDTEAGGITQHIGAYSIDLNGEKITFLDTPGHEAFTSMRARGAQATDIVVIVVAADDGVMPQTIEAINHVKAAGVPLLIAINKMDLPAANPDRVKQELTEYEIVTEEWGGDVIMVPVSAITGEGLDDLLENISLIAEMEDLKANPDALARCVVIEAKMDHSRGAVTTVLVQNGTLHVGDTVIAGVASGRIRAMVDDKGNKLKEAGPSTPVEVTGFSDVPNAGDIMHVVTDEKLARRVAEDRNVQHKAEQLRLSSRVSLDDLFNKIEQDNMKKLNIIIKADVQGSVEAVRQALERLSNDEIKITTIHSGVGAVNETDIMLATASNAIVIGFNVRADAVGRAAAEREKIDVRLYRIIYKAIEDMELAMKGMLDPEFKEEIVGHAQVRNTFKVSSIGTIAGCYITDGLINRNCDVRIYRDDIMIYEGKLASLKRFKDDVREVTSGYECGISIAGYNDIKENDVFEAFRTVEIER